MEVRGTLDWVPPPSPVLWWAGVVLGFAGVAPLGLRWTRVRPLLAVLALVGGVVALGYPVARELDAGNRSLGPIVLALLVSQLWTLLTALAALAAGLYALRPRPATELALGLAGACLALFAGAANAVVFARGVAPVPGDPMWARVAVAVVLVAGAGLAGAAGLRLRTAAAPAPRSAGG